MRLSDSRFNGTSVHQRFHSCNRPSCHDTGAPPEGGAETPNSHCGSCSRQEHTTLCVWYSGTCSPTVVSARPNPSIACSRRPTEAPNYFLLTCLLMLRFDRRTSLRSHTCSHCRLRTAPRPRPASAFPRMPLARSHVPRIRMQPCRLTLPRLQRRTPPRDPR